MFLYIKAGNGWKAKINPKTGEIKAVRLYPYHREFSGTISDWNNIIDSPDNLLEGAKRIHHSSLD